MKLVIGQSKYSLDRRNPLDTVCVSRDGNRYPLMRVSLETMLPFQKTPKLFGFPMYFCFDTGIERLMLYPAPDAEYELDVGQEPTLADLVRAVA